MRNLSANALSAVIGAAAFAVFTTGTAVAVTTSNVSITDPSTGTRARVVGSGLVVNARDSIPVTTRTLTAGISAPSNDLYAEDDTESVPSSARFEVQTVSVQLILGQGQRPRVRLLYTSGTRRVTLYLPLEYVYGNPATGSDYWAATEDVHLYMDPGTKLTVAADRNGTGGAFELSFSATGHSG